MLDTLHEGSTFHHRYLIKRKIGSGGMGSIYEALQIDAERVVALKLLNTDLVSSEEDRQRFLREFRALSSLSHQHIITFFSAAISDEGIPYAVCEFIEGKNLRQALDEAGKMGWEDTAQIVLQIAQAMDVAHKQNIIHRDLKPENIMLLDKSGNIFVKVLDFGLSKVGDTASSGNQISLTQTGALIGTVDYMAPEQCMGRPADARSDIYALACIAYECICGKKLFEADTPIGLLHHHINTPVTKQLKELRNICPGNFVDLLEEMLSKTPDKRPQGMNVVTEELKQLTKSPQKIKAARIPTLSKGLLSLLLLILGTVTSVVVYRFTQEPSLSPAKMRAHKYKHDEIEKLILRSNEMFTLGQKLGAEALLQKWLKNNPEAPAIFKAELCEALYEHETDVNKKYLDLLRAFEYRRELRADYTNNQKQLANIYTLAAMSSQYFDRERLDKNLSASMTYILSGDPKNLTYHAAFMRWFRRSTHRPIGLHKSKKFEWGIKNPAASEDAIRFYMYLGDMAALQQDKEYAESSYAKANMLEKKLLGHDSGIAILYMAHLARRKALLKPREASKCLDAAAAQITMSGITNVRPWYILWGGADDKGDVKRAEQFGEHCWNDWDHDDLESFFYLSYCLERLATSAIERNDQDQAKKYAERLISMTEITPGNSILNYTFLLNLSERCKQHKNLALAKVLDSAIEKENEKYKYDAKFNTVVYKAFLNPNSEESQIQFNKNAPLGAPPIWVCFIANEAAESLNKEIKKAATLAQVTQILKPVQALSSRFLADLKGSILIRYADRLNFVENNKVAAAQAYDAAFDELDKDPISINDSDLSYDNDAWLELRARLSELGCR